MDSFTEERLEVNYDYGVVGGPEFSTDVIVINSGHERRNVNWNDPRRPFQLGERIIDKPTLDYISGFFQARRGRAQGFRLKDWSDWYAEDEPLIIDGSDTTQLIKTYGASNFLIRDIVKPISDSIVIKVNGDVYAEYALDDTTGLITWLGSPIPAPEDVVTWSGEFDIPARFDTDRLQATFEAYEDSPRKALYQLASLPAIEIRV